MVVREFYRYVFDYPTSRSVVTSDSYIKSTRETGKITNIHWYENTATGQRVEFKSILLDID